MKFFVHPAIDGRWHVVYRDADRVLHSVADSACRDAMVRRAEELNAEEATAAA